MLNIIQYNNPKASLLLFAIIPFVIGYFFLFRYREKWLSSFASQNVLKVVLIKRSKRNAILKALLFIVAFTFATLALMGPKKIKDTQSVSEFEDVAFLIDVSASMGVKDVKGPDGIGQERLQFAKNVVGQVIEPLAGKSLSLYAFTSSLIEVVPPTTDSLFLRLMLSRLHVDEEETFGTDLQVALEGAITNAQESFHKKIAIILITDGGDTLLQTAKEADIAARKEQILKSLSHLQEIYLITLAIGSKEGGLVPNVTYQNKQVVSALEEKLIKEISAKASGKYIASEGKSMATVAEEVTIAVRDFFEKGSAKQDNNYISYQDHFQIPLLIAIAALLLLFTLPDTRIKKQGKKPLIGLILLSMLPHPIAADELVPLFGNAYFEAKNYQKALTLYQAGQLQKSNNRKITAILYYNAGTMQLALNRYQEALKSFNEAHKLSYDDKILSTRIMHNKAIADMFLTNDIEDHAAADQKWREILSSIDEEIHLLCSLQTQAGVPTCHIPLKQENLKKEANLRYQEFLKKREKQKTTLELNPQENKQKEQEKETKQEKNSFQLIQEMEQDDASNTKTLISPTNLQNQQLRW